MKSALIEKTIDTLNSALAKVTARADLTRHEIEFLDRKRADFLAATINELIPDMSAATLKKLESTHADFVTPAIKSVFASNTKRLFLFKGDAYKNTLLLLRELMQSSLVNAGYGPLPKFDEKLNALRPALALMELRVAEGTEFIAYLRQAIADSAALPDAAYAQLEAMQKLKPLEPLVMVSLSGAATSTDIADYTDIYQYERDEFDSWLSVLDAVPPKALPADDVDNNGANTAVNGDAKAQAAIVIDVPSIPAPETSTQAAPISYTSAPMKHFSTFNTSDYKN